ncbi:S-layer homology domain-containing protein [Bacillus toyonensis]|uniref:S-layer homology domain-containing protein n=1 Tax=Bacillus toyonensis TaxID=155322 RepID=UPI000BF840F9|nr:S-layer homology domain-containing protein [Bacillus toyonensis]PGF05243.1 N-acetylmuramoyl-L-alanine amidase [Bacillus toyonensis]
MKKSIKKQVVALTTGLTILGSIPLNALADQTDKLQVATGEHLNQGSNLANIELKTPDVKINESEISPNEKVLLEEYKHKHDTSAEMEKMKEAKTGAVDPNEAVQNVENAFKDVDGKGDGSSREMTPKRQKRSLAFAPASQTTKRYGTLAGTKFVEWIVPAGNIDIRPQNPMKAKYITIHETANTERGANAEAHAKYLYNQATQGTFRTASWHFTVDDKQIYQHLPTNENGWHAGDGNGPGNRESIGIEIAVNQDGDYNKALENAKRLAGYLMNKEGIPASNIVKHQHWSGKKCPDIMISRGNFAGFVQGIEWYSSLNNNIEGMSDKQEDNNSNEVNPAEPVMELVVKGYGINIRSGAGIENGVVGKANAGDKFRVLAVKNGWYKTEKGWIFYDSSYIKINYNVENPLPKPEEKPKPEVKPDPKPEPQPEPKPQPTDDITGGWFEPHVRELNKRGIMVGEGNGVFAPYRAVTRAEFAKLISNSLQLPSGDANFKDLDQAHPTLQDGIKRASSAGIINGRGDGIFDPNSPITREESAIMVDKALQYKGIKGDASVPLKFRDKHLINYKENVTRLYSLGIANGNENGEFSPQGTTTRGESAAFLVRMLNVMEETKVIGTAYIDQDIEVHAESGNWTDVVRTLTKGNTVNVYAEHGAWIQIGKNEWIKNDTSKIRYVKD